MDRVNLQIALHTKQAKHPHTKLFVFTGGEPLLQQIFDLIDELPEGCIMQVETAGTVWPRNPTAGEAARLSIVCSPKTPLINAAILPYVTAWKYIIAPGEISEDGLPNMSTQLARQPARIYRPPANHPAPIYVQPRDDNSLNNDLHEQFAAHVAMQHGYRLSLQTHKWLRLP
jgi:organic radical activating enzyme